METSADAEDAVAELLVTLFNSSPATYFNVETGISIVSVFKQRKPDARHAKVEIAAGLKRIADCDLNIDPGRIEITQVKREDWAESWKRHFQPLEIGKSLLVKPSWSKQKALRKQAVVVLDPGLSFGTGQHPTTLFCLGEIVRCRETGKAQSFLDIGTGSGILAIAAAKMGYQPAHAFDFDPDAVRVSRENARKNRVDAKVKLTRSDITKLSLKPARQFDLVCANLISNLLISEKERIVNRLKLDGTLVLAGILATEFEEVEQEYTSLDLKLVSKKVDMEWGSGSFCFA